MPTSADKMWAAYGGQWVPIPTAPATSTWTRPAYWPTTTVTVGEQKIQMVVTVWNYSNNPLTIVASGAYTVDWGDNTGTQNFATGATAVHNYSWSASGLTATTPEGYRCALVTITPQASNQLTSLGLTTSNSGTLNYSSPVLEVVVGPSTLTTFTVGSGGVSLVACMVLRHVNFLSPVTLNGNRLFQWCRSLRKVTGNITLTTSCFATFAGCLNLTDLPSALTIDATVTDCTSFFDSCPLLTSFPKMDTSRVTNFSYFFGWCSAMAVAPLLNTSAGTNFYNMFTNCFALVSVPLYDTANGTDFTSMFYRCRILTTAPALNTAKGTSFASMFEGCYNLRDVPTYNTSLGTSFMYMFYACYCLENLPALNTANGTDFTSYVEQCNSLASVPAMNTAKGTEFYRMFSSCTSLTQVPTLNTALATGTTCFVQMFSGCHMLTYIPNTINAAGGTVTGAFNLMFNNCESLKSNPFAAGGGPKYSFTVADTMLDTTELNALFTSLPSVSGQTITITNTPGSAGCNRAIATGKGWTVTG